jgi:enamine deaminase RidA (YjgF/YER057c/UK114 family)
VERDCAPRDRTQSGRARREDAVSQIEEKLKTMGLALPAPPAPVANYVGAVQAGDLVFVSGHGPVKDGKLTYRGKLGRDFSVAEGYEAARLVMLNCLASLRDAIGDLDRVKRVVKLLGMVNSTPDFLRQPEVINGASDLLVGLFGDRGHHARSAVGMAVLPFDIAVEIEMIVQVS